MAYFDTRQNKIIYEEDDKEIKAEIELYFKRKGTGIKPTILKMPDFFESLLNPKN